ncbi:MAG: sugar transferase [Roseibium sp.]
MTKKSLFDFLVAISALTVLAPIVIGISIAIYIKLGQPVLFTQYRPGLNGKAFKMLKFRTMRDARDPLGIPLSDSERLGSFGKKLRNLSLDELPGLWNVVRGEMSLVGPRPLLMEYLPLYTEEQSRRHEVKPGITGWAQVNGRNAISWDQKFELDVWYVDNQSFLLDLRILLITLMKVLKREGISAKGADTMPKFTGSKPETDGT